MENELKPNSVISNPPPPILPPPPGQPPPPPPVPCTIPFPTTLEAAHAEILRLRQLQAEASDLIAEYRKALAGKREHPGDEGPKE